MKKNIEQLLEGVLISITDRCLHFPCLASRPKVEYPNFMWWRYTQGSGANKYKTNTLYLPIKDKSYKEIGENLYEALTGEKCDLFELDNLTRKILYDTITSRIKK